MRTLAPLRRARAFFVACTRLVLGLLAASAPACAVSDPGGTETATTDGSSTTAPARQDPHATFLAKLDGIDLCGVEGATVVRFLARQVGCVHEAAPCTLKTDPYMEWTGDSVACPSSQTALDVAVEVPVSGRFQVEAQTLTGSGTLSRCYGAGGEVPTLVTPEQLDARAQIFVTTTAKSCPPP